MSIQDVNKKRVEKGRPVLTQRQYDTARRRGYTEDSIVYTADPGSFTPSFDSGSSGGDCGSSDGGGGGGGGDC